MRELEMLSVIWRGDAHRGEDAEQMLAQDLRRNRPLCRTLLAAAKTATRLQPNSELSRQGQDAASALFSQLYLGPKGDDMKPVDALAMFYEYRELTPIGRRGDEMIRRLADRLVAVDLLDQAAELLQYQVDKRLEGAARAQVGGTPRHGLPDQPQAGPRHHGAASTRIADLSGDYGSSGYCWKHAPRATSGDTIRARYHLKYHRARGDPAAFRYLLGVTAVARGLRTDRTVLRRSLARLQTAERGGEGRRDSRGGRICARRGRTRPGRREKYVPLMSGDTDRMAFDLASKRPPPAAPSSLRSPKWRQASIRSTARPRNEVPLPRCYRARTAAGGDAQGRAGPYRFLARDRQPKAGQRGQITAAGRDRAWPVSIAVRHLSRVAAFLDSAPLRGHHRLRAIWKNCRSMPLTPGRIEDMTTYDWRSGSPC